jgi:hypothetical protein
MLAEATTTEISKEKNPSNFLESKEIAKKWGRIAGNTRREIEAETWENIVSSKNARSLQNKETKKLRK